MVILYTNYKDYLLPVSKLAFVQRTALNGGRIGAVRRELNANNMASAIVQIVGIR